MDLLEPLVLGYVRLEPAGMSAPKTISAANVSSSANEVARSGRGHVSQRADTAGAVCGFLEGLVERNCEFSTSGWVSAPLDVAIAAVPDTASVPALDADGTLREVRGSSS